MASHRGITYTAQGNMKFQNIDGVNYLTFRLVKDVAKHLDAIRNLEMKDDDVIAIGFPRSGNHLVFEMANMILRQDVKYAEEHFASHMLELMGEDIVSKLQEMSSPRYLLTHHRAHRIPLQAIEKRIKLIYLMRNPKDVLVFLYRLTSSYKADAQRYDGSWDEFFELQMTGDFQQGSWFDHVLAMEQFMKEQPECPVYIFSFEKMKRDRLGVIKELCTFLGQSDILAEEIEKVTEFNHMKSTLRKGKMKQEESGLLDKSDSLFRTGEIGGWKEYFTVSQSKRFDDAFKEKMSGCKLAQLVQHYL